VEAELIEGSGGIFDVVVDNKLIYCKQETGRFPTNEEILQQLKT
jgi:selenoprotein W-related protein